MIQKIIILFFFLLLYECSNIKNAHVVNYNETFYYEGMANVYSNINKSLIVKKLSEFSDHENLARDNVKIRCLDYIKINNLKGVSCKYMGTRPTIKITSSLN
jgi:hypothetical protein